MKTCEFNVGENVISLALKPGDKVAVSAQGSDETQAAETVEKLLG